MRKTVHNRTSLVLKPTRERKTGKVVRRWMRAVPRESSPDRGTAPGSYLGVNVNAFEGQVVCGSITLDAAEELLGKPVSARDLAMLAGAHKNEVVRIAAHGIGRTRYTDAIRVKIEHPSYEAIVTIHNATVRTEFIRASRAGVGVGARLIAQQAAMAERLGISYLTLEAARIDPMGGPQYNGYYTWARLGFDGSFKRALRYPLKDRPAHLAKAKTVQQLMMCSGGAEWWKANGVNFKAKFEVRVGSVSRQVLEGYLQEKGF